MRFKNDFLKEFRQDLENEIENKNTRKNYYYEIRKAFLKQEFSDVNDFDYEKLKKYFEQIKGKRSASTLKCALKLFSKKYPEFKFDENREFFEKHVSNKKNNRLTKWEELNWDKTSRRINSIKDKKLKLSYRLIFGAGLRVEELERVKKKDINLEESKILVHGKYDKERIAEILEDDYLRTELERFVKFKKDDDTLFYNKEYLMKYANENGFMCHDLRRAYSQVLKDKKLFDEDMTEEEAIKEVQKNLGHVAKSTTYKKYLGRKIDFSKTKYKYI
jgi:integrase